MTQMMNCSCIPFASWRDGFMNYYWSNSHCYWSCSNVPPVLIRLCVFVLSIYVELGMSEVVAKQEYPPPAQRLKKT